MVNMKSGLVIAAVVLFVLIFGVVSYVLLSADKLELVSTSPQDNERVDGFRPTIEFEFNQDLENYADYESSPTINAEVHANKDTLIINPEHELLENQEYTLRIPSVKSTSGETLENIELAFSTGLDQSPRAKFIRELPVYRSGFNITYTKRSDIFIVQITDTPISQNKEKAKQFLQENGITEDTESIKYEVMRSLQGSGSPAG